LPISIHAGRIIRVRSWQKHLATATLKRISKAVFLAGSLALAGCPSTAIVESSATAVTVRYGGISEIDDATRLAQAACARHRKTARLRNTANFGLSERYGHFDCV
jgi:hypothetical protein